MSIYKRATVLAAAASLVAVWGLAEAAQLTQADVDACNREAQARVSSPAASPRTTPDIPSSTPIPGTQGPTGTPGMGASNESGTTGALGTPPGSSATGIGPGGPVPGSAGVPPAAVDPLLRGSAGQGNPAYEQAYRECLRRRGF